MLYVAIWEQVSHREKSLYNTYIYIEKFFSLYIQYRIVHVEKKRKERHDRHLTNKFFDVPIPGTEGRERC